mgnify:CR=1 FL=1
MKSLEELAAIRNKMQNVVNLRSEASDCTRIVVGMATCGIAAGARPVLKAFSDGIQEKGIKDVMVIQEGCIGLCQYEPVVEVITPGKEKVTYVRVNPDMVPRIVAEHIVNGRPVQEYTIGAAEGE